MDAYDVYCDWARDHNRPVLTREQFQAWCLAISENHASQIDVRADQREFDRERSEGWAHA